MENTDLNKVMFTDYKDIVTVPQLAEMLQQDIQNMNGGMISENM